MTVIRLYKTYSFKNKDPIIDELRTCIQDEFGSREIHLFYSQIEERTGVSRSTLVGWFEGEVRRPQHATVRAVAQGIGYEYRLVKRTGKVVPLRKSK